MGNRNAEKEELKKLENEAYSELCQIIAEAMQVQDITLLDQRIANWKKKYKKLLDSNSSASANFKKRIEYLLNEYYSEITQYILKQIKKGEEKRLEKQSKLIRKLYNIIEDTNDLALLKKKIKEWEDKYPISGFLNMYQKRIKVYTSEKYLKEHAFDQDMAFRDLYYITKLNRTYDEFKKEITNWEDKYSIHNNFELDDFIKHQSDVNRYTSDDYLKSIAHEDNINTPDIELQEPKVLDSSLPRQASAYSALISISRKPNNINEVFKWVYKYNSIKFNDEYKNLILSAIDLDYSPKYLNSLSIPKISLSKSLSFEEYQNIDEIKRYTVISYFNLLLPPEKAISNNYFSQNIEEIYYKSITSRFSEEYEQFDEILEENNEIEVQRTKTETPELEIDVSNGQTFDLLKPIEQVSSEDISNVKITPHENVSGKDESAKIVKNILNDIGNTTNSTEEPLEDLSEPIVSSGKPLEDIDKPIISKKEHSEKIINAVEATDDSFENKSKENLDSDKNQESYEPISSYTVLALSPLFFETINNKVHAQKQQSTIISTINSHVDTYMTRNYDISLDTQTKTRTDSN